MERLCLGTAVSLISWLSGSPRKSCVAAVWPMWLFSCDMVLSEEQKTDFSENQDTAPISGHTANSSLLYPSEGVLWTLQHSLKDPEVGAGSHLCLFNRERTQQ